MYYGLLSPTTCNSYLLTYTAKRIHALVHGHTIQQQQIVNLVRNENATKEGSTRCDIKIQQASTSPSCSKTVNPTIHHACQNWN